MAAVKKASLGYLTIASSASILQSLEKIPHLHLNLVITTHTSTRTSRLLSKVQYLTLPYGVPDLYNVLRN